MLEAQTSPKSGESVWIWLIKLLTGLVIVVILLIHLIVNHIIPEGALFTHADVVEYYRNMLVIIMEAVFLIVVVSHSLIGMRSIFLDLKPSRSTLRAVDVVLVIIGVVATGYGLWLLSAVRAQI